MAPRPQTRKAHDGFLAAALLACACLACAQAQPGSHLEARKAAAAKKLADMSSCPLTPLKTRAACFCKQLTSAGFNRYYADTSYNYSGAIFCRSATRSNYTSCGAGQLFDQLRQRCDAAANVPRPEAVPLCSSGFTTSTKCGSSAASKCCKLPTTLGSATTAASCCSARNTCSSNAADCSSANGCQRLYGLCDTVATPTKVQLPSGPLMVGYYESWSAQYLPGTTTLDIAKIPGHVNVVIVGFAKPDCTYVSGSLDISYSRTGLIFDNDFISASGAGLKASIAALKAAQPNTRVLLSAGGGDAAYNNWKAINTQCLKALVDDLGFDGVDIDFEKDTTCTTASSPTDRISCSTDAELVGAATALRAAMPAGQYLLATASTAFGMYGEGNFLLSKPVADWLKTRGSQLALARSPAGQSLDLVTIMAYLAGWVGGNGWDWRECYRAHRVHWKTQAVAIGVMVTPAEGPADWDGYAITLPDLLERASYARDLSGGAQYGIMLWSLQLGTNCPNAQNITTAVCQAYGLPACSTPLPFVMDRSCGGSDPQPPPKDSCQSWNRCGFRYNNSCCAAGQCCSAAGYCGNTTDHCQASAGCQAAYGRCSGGSNPGPTCNSWDRCGAQYGSACCAAGQCCSAAGYCGNTTDHCQASAGCQAAYGRCSGGSNPGPTCNSWDRCGAQYGSACCAAGQCCSAAGYCGNTTDHCQASAGCQAAYGRCSGGSNPGPTCNSWDRCGAQYGSACCAAGQCCSAAGYCGNTTDHCQASAGCQAAYGRCSGGSNPGPTCDSWDRCGAQYGSACCAAGQCCSAAGYCGNTTDHCQASAGCQAAYGRCSNTNTNPKVKLPSGPLMVGYYESWSAKYLPGTTTLDIAKIPGHVNVVIVGFAKPDCTYVSGSLDISYSRTGLIFDNNFISASGAGLKASIAALKAAQPNTRVLLSAGGGDAAYNNWKAINTQCLKALVDDLGFDGVDIDFEKDTTCTTASSPTDRISCSTDAELVGAATALRAAMPAGQYLLATASTAFGMYGEGNFLLSKPVADWLKTRGSQLALARSPAGQSLDLVTIMAYLAGWVGGNGWDWRECYRAHRVHWKTQAVAIGVMVTPAEGPADWDGYAITLPDLLERASYARDLSGGAQYGIMLWSLQLGTNCPNAQNITTAVCQAYGLPACSTPLPFVMDRSCGGSDPQPPPKDSCQSWNRCGFRYNNSCCAAGQCCSAAGYCGNTTDHCQASAGCQAAYGRCSGGSNPGPTCNSWDRCGAQYGSACCAAGQCCSAAGYCGNTTDHCQASAGCQAAYGMCSGGSNPGPTCNSWDRCGAQYGSACCAAGQCCSAAGYCGNTTDHCQASAGCQAAYGRCSGGSNPGPTCDSWDRCGAQYGSACCAAGQCCSAAGYCGNTTDHCQASAGCQAAYGRCSGGSNPGPTCNSWDRCGAQYGSACCAAGQCCSAAGYCGNTTDHCQASAGCQAAYGRCSGGSNPGPTCDSWDRCGAQYGSACCAAGQCCSAAGYCGNTTDHCQASAGCQAAYGRCSNTNTNPKVKLPSGPLMVGYYESWSAKYLPGTTTLDIAKIPGHVNVVIVGFAKPDCTYVSGSLDISYSRTGLIFDNDFISASGAGLKASIAALKAAQPNTRVLLSAGGGDAAYNNWKAINTQCLKALVDDLGFDGVDIDFEKDTTCTTASSPTDRISCSTDAELVGAATALRAAMPAGQYLLATASTAFGMYGEGNFLLSKPVADWLKTRGSQLALARSPAGQSLDLVTIMAYLAGWVGGNGWDWRECYRAHRVHWKTQAVAIGVMVTPAEGPADWDGYAITLPDLLERASYARDLSGGAQYGIMLWSLQLGTNCPNAQNITTAVCQAYGLPACSTPLPFFMGRSCSNTTTAVNCEAQPRSGGRCGVDAGGACCADSLCCSAFGYCGRSDDHCLQINACQLAFGSCDSKPAPMPSSKCSGLTWGRCGAAFGNACCAGATCCSGAGYCANSTDHCGAGCQRDYGRCE